ncbi:MAG: hypothetical protein P4L67_04170 [Candidatus Pacebacteria bacterium]|nr:hypothetical protein [Candidatus Paceibacterota bacterium]
MALVADTEQKGMIEEDVKNKKTFTLLQETYTLLMKIEHKFEEKEKGISRLHRSQRVLTASLKRRSQSQHLTSKGSASSFRSGELSRGQSLDSDREAFKYKNIMCPLKDRCPGDVRPRWPNTETKSICKLGSACPYAHHYSELHFVYDFDFTRG